MIVNSSIKLAFHLPTQKIIHIQYAENGLSCNCECFDCKEKLEAIQGEIRDWHFRHNSNKNCNGGQETALHQLGKQILLDNNQITIPVYGIINYSNPIAEQEFYSTRPDVTAIFNEQNIYFEIAVSHFVEKDKETFYATGQHRCVEIDLSNADMTSYEKIKSIILIETNNKKLFGWKQPQNKQDADSSLVGKLALGTLLLLFVGWLFGGRRR